jgi:hypothetical protein
MRYRALKTFVFPLAQLHGRRDTLLRKVLLQHQQGPVPEVQQV